MTPSIIARFTERCARVLRGQHVHLLENPTEEIVADTQRGKSVKLFAARPGVRRPVMNRGIARLEENYLYASRRFPSLTNNTIGGGALTVNSYPFFQQAAGAIGDAAGFPTGFVLSLNETNMELPGQVPLGQSFVFNQLGISFNADATVGDVNTLLEAATLTFSKGNSFMLNHGPLKFWPGGTGNGGQYGTMTAAATSQFGANGQPNINAVRKLSIPRTIRQNETFSYAFVIPRTTKATDGSSWALSNFVVATIWLWGGHKAAIAA